MQAKVQQNLGNENELTKQNKKTENGVLRNSILLGWYTNIYVAD